MTTLPAARRAELERLLLPAAGVGVVALVVCVVGAIFDPQQFFRAYLSAYLFYLGIAHGCFAILMLYYLTGGAWGFLIRRTLEAGMRTLPLLALLFAPIAWGVGYLYPWARPEEAATQAGLRHQEVYLNAGFFWFRAALFFVAWVLLVYLLTDWSRREDQTGDPRYTRRLVRLSGPGLLVYGITITFASVDWVMSLQPAFRSTIFGPLFATGEILAGMACTLIVLAWVVVRPPLAGVISVEALNDLGNLLFTFLIIWAYMAFFQFMLIWIANLPYDSVWYLPRSENGWQYVAWALFLFEFAVPFFLLLVRDIKRNPRALAAVAALVLGMHLVYQYYQVAPPFLAMSLGQHWMDFLTPLAVGGLWLAYFLWQLTRFPVLPRHDANQQAAIHYHELDLEQLAREQELHHG
jgi:hypothetical protein